MKLILFTGPTLDAATVHSMLDAEVRGPVSFGDVYRAGQRRPDAIAIIDGYFDRVAAVWHKEILWALSEGIHVFGAASMGALRAAELCAFGMVGVGEIFRAFQSGELEDDDEVAVVHGDADSGFSAHSDAMVNIRATLRKAVADAVIDADCGEALQQLAKSRFYADRSFSRLLHDASSANVHREGCSALRDWLPSGRVDAKRADALELLDHLSHWGRAQPGPQRVSFRFNPTDAWHQATRLAGSGDGDESSSDLAGILEELKVAGTYAAVWQAAAARGAALHAAVRAGVRPDNASTRRAVEQLRVNLDLTDPGSLEQWRQEQLLSEPQAVRLFQDQARLRWAEPLFDEFARGQLLDYLRSCGEYGRLQVRAAAKQVNRTLAHSPGAELSQLGVSSAELWEWYFTRKLQRPVPANLDSHARKAGFADATELQAAVVRELMYCRAINDA